MEFADVSALLDPSPLALETGYERLADGSLHVAARTDMNGCTGEMFEWWFRWRCDTQKYVWWHPVDHVHSGWQGDLRDDTHVGSEHVVEERLTDIPNQGLLVQFVETASFFAPGDYAAALAAGTVSGAVVGRTGMGHEPPRLPTGEIVGGRLLHVCRDTPWGMVLRSHFFLGTDLPLVGASAQQVEVEVPLVLGPNLLAHAYNEFTFLSHFLPSLFIAEHRDVRAPEVPW